MINLNFQVVSIPELKGMSLMNVARQCAPEDI